MSNLTKIEEVRLRLQNHLDALHKEAEHNRHLFQIGKAAGFGGFALGAIGCIALPAAGIVVVGAGIATYLGSLFSESSVTGEITPIPFVATRLGTIAGVFIQESAGISDDDLEHAEYLPKRDRFLYLMILCQGERIAAALAQLPENQWMPAIEALITQNMKLNTRFGFLDAVRDGEGILNMTERDLGLKSTAASALPMQQKEPVKIMTQFGEQSAVNVPAQSIPDRTVAEYISQTPAPRPVEADIQKAKIQLFANGKINPAILAMPLNDRANFLLDILSRSDCKIRSLIGRPTLASGGLQRSGKTTLILLTAIFEKALGNKVFYISRDNDLYPIAFDGYANGSIETALNALADLSKTINSTSMGGMRGQTWILDEFSSISMELKDNQKRQFWSMALTGFAKQGGRVRFMVHHKTAGANGLPPGQAETFKSEVKMLWTERGELPDGTYIPSGKYELLEQQGGYYRESGEKFEIPEWLKFDKNPSWHDAPCPVRSLLRFFPEFDTRQGAIAQSLSAKTSDPFDLDDLWDVPAFKSSETSNPGEEWRSQSVTVAPVVTISMSNLDQQFARITETMQNLDSGQSIYVNAIASYFNLSASSAAQLVTLYAFKNKTVAFYDSTQQALVKK